MFKPWFRVRACVWMTTLLCVAFAVLFPSQQTTAASGINRQLNYQARLLNASAVSVADGAYSVKFSLYDAATGGNRLWTAGGTTVLPTAVSVTLTSGLMTVQLGDTSAGQNALDIDWNQDSLYLGVTIGSDAEMLPRKRLTAVPYAFMAESLQGQFASSSVSAAGGNLFKLQQNSPDAASSPRTALFISTSGTSNVNDFLIKAASDSEVFTVSRQGHTTTTGNFASNGSMIVGDTSADTVIFNAQINSSLVPATNSQFDIGSGANSWRDIYASGTANVGHIVATDSNTSTFAWMVSSTNFLSSSRGNLSKPSFAVGGDQDTGIAGSGADGNLVFVSNGTQQVLVNSATFSVASAIWGTTNNAYDLGISSNAWKNAYVSGTLSVGSVTTSGPIGPSANNLFDLGSGSNSWNDIFASGTVYGNNFVGVGTATSTLNGPVSSTQFVANYGTASSPAFAFSNKNDGIFYTGLAVAIGVGGNQVMKVDNGDMTITGHFYPGSNNALDIGRASNSWRDIYASGTLSIGAGSVSSPAINFAGSNNSGWYSPSAGTVSLALNGVGPYMTISPSANGVQLGVGITFASNNAYSIGSGSASLANLFASGTAYIGTDVVVGGSSVCLVNGTNCPSSVSSTDMNWAYNSTLDVVTQATATTDLVLGGTATTTAPVFFSLLGDTASTSRLILGQNQNMDVVIGGTTSTATNSAFQFSGNDLFVEGNIGSATSVYTNGAFIAGSGTYYAERFISNSNGAFSINAGNTTTLSFSAGSVTSSADIVPLITNRYDLGSSAFSWRNIYASGTLAIGGVTTTANIMPAVSNTGYVGTSNTYFKQIVGESVQGIVQVIAPSFIRGGGGSGIKLDQVVYGADSFDLRLRIDSLDRWGFPTTGHFIPLQHNVYDIGSGVSSTRNIYASGTAFIGTDVVVGGASVCLSSGINCPSSASSTDLNWAYNVALDLMTQATATADIVIGGSSTTTAPVFFSLLGDTASTSRLILGQNQNMDVVIGGTTSTATSKEFQFSGNDLFVFGNIGSASSVYTNGSMYVNGTVSSTRFLAENGSATVPAFSFSTRGDVGFYSQAAGAMSFVSGGTNVLNLDASSITLGANFYPSTNNTRHLGLSTNSWANIYASGTLFVGGVTSSGPISPFINNAYDIGTMATSWRNIYSSGTIYGASQILTGTSTAGPYTFTPDSGAVTAMDYTCSGASPSEQVCSYEFDVNGLPFFTVYSRADGAAGLQTTSTAIRYHQPLIASPHNAIDIGAMGTNAFRNIYASSTIFAGGGVTSTGHINPSINNTFDLGSAGASWRNIFASGTLFVAGVTSSGPISPFATNSYDLGSSAASWNDAYVSGTVFTQSISATATLRLISNLNTIDATPAFTFNTQNTLAYPSRMLEFRNNGTMALYCDVAGSCVFGASSLVTIDASNGRLQIGSSKATMSMVVGENSFQGIANSAASVPFLARGAAAQTADLQQWQDSSSNVLARVTADGSIYSSGTMRVASDVVVNGSSVCLSTGVNCPATSAVSSTDLNWAYNGALDLMTEATATTDIVIGGTATTTAPVFFSLLGDTASTSRLILGQNQNMDVVIGGTTSTASNTLFQFSGNDLFVEGNIGSATSVYTNGAFIAGSGSTMYGNGFITNTNGALTFNTGNASVFSLNTNSVTSSADIVPSTDGSYALGSQSLRWLGLNAINVTTTNLAVTNLSSVSTITPTTTAPTVFRTIRNSAVFAGGESGILAISGRYAYAVDTNRLITIDIADPSSATTVSSLASVAVAGGRFVVAGKLGYLTGNTSFGLRIFDLSIPAQPVQIAEGDAGSGNIPLAVSGKWAYVGGQTSPAVVSIDVSSSTNPIRMSTMTSSTAFGSISDIKVNGALVYVAANSQFTVLDYGSSTYPLVKGMVRDATNLSSPGQFVIRGAYAYVPANNTLNVINITSATAPRIVATLTDSTNLAGAESVALAGSTLYVTGQTNDTVVAIDISDPLNPRKLGVLTDSVNLNTPQTIIVDGMYAYVSVGTTAADSGVTILKLTGSAEFDGADIGSINAGSIFAAESVDVGGRLTVFGGANIGGGVTVQGEFAVQGQNTSTINGKLALGRGLQIDSGSISFLPTDVVTAQASTSSGLGQLQDIVIQDRYLYTTDSSNSRFWTFDTLNPGAPVGLATIRDTTFLASAQGLAINGGYAYTLAGTRLTVIDVKNPVNPYIVTSTIMVGATAGKHIEIQGKYAYVINADDTNQVLIYDLTSSTNPILVRSISDRGTIDIALNAMDIYGNWLYISGSSQDLFTAIDITNPLTATTTYSIAATNGGEENGVVAAGRYVYRTGGTFGASLQVIDTSSTKGLAVTTCLGTISGSPGGPLVIAGKYAYIGEPGEVQISDIELAPACRSIGRSALSGAPTPKDMALVGKHLYITTGSGLRAITLAGLEVPAATIGSVFGGSAYFSQGIFTGGNVVTNGGLQSLGDLVTQGTVISYGLATSTYYGSLMVQGASQATIYGSGFMTTPDGAFSINAGNTTTLRINAGSVTSSADIVPAITNLYNLGSAQKSWGNMYASGTLTIGGSLGVAADALSPAITARLDIGSETARWNRLHVGDVYLNGTVVIASGLVTSASTTRVITSSYAGLGDQAFMNREYLFTGSTYGQAAQTLSLIESTTGTMKITNGSADGGFGNLLVGSVTSIGTIAPGVNNLFDLGTAENSWRNVYVSGTLVVPSIALSGDLTVSTTAPVLIRSVKNTGTLGSSYTQAPFAISKGFAYVANANAQLTIFDITNPYTATSVSMTALSSTSLGGVVVAGKYAYLGEGSSNKLFIVDISNPAAPEQVHASAIAGLTVTGKSVAISGHYLYLADGATTNQLNVIDISSARSPKWKGSYASTTALLASTQELSLAADGSRLFVRGLRQLTIFNVASSTPYVLGQLYDETNLSEGGIVVRGSYAYLPSTDRFLIVDISNAATPRIVGSLISASFSGAANVSLAGNIAYVTDPGNTSVIAVDISSSTNPVITGSLTDATELNFVNGIIVSGRYAYLPKGHLLTNAGFSILKIPGLEMNAASFGALSAGTLFTVGDADIGGSLNIRGGATLEGGGLVVGSELAVQGTGTSTFAGMVSTTRVFVNGGSAASPGLSIDNTGGSGGVNGFYAYAGNQMGVALNGAGPYTIFTGGSLGTMLNHATPMANNSGNLGLANWSWAAAYVSGTVAGGNFVGSGTATSTFNGPVSTTRVFATNPTGSCANPAFAFSAFPTSGLCEAGSGIVGIASNGIAIATFSSAGVVSFNGRPKPLTNNLLDIGDGSLSWRDIYASGTLFVGGVTSSGPISPFATNAYDLGSMAYSWRNIYASGTLSVGGRADLPYLNRWFTNPLLTQTIKGDASATTTLGGSPIRAAFDGSHVWVSNASGNIYKIDVTTNASVATVAVGSGPGNLAFDGTSIWVSNNSDATVSKVNITSNVAVATVPVGTFPTGVAFDGAFIWVASNGTDKLSKIDISTNTVVATATVGANPDAIAFDGRHLWVTSGGNLSKVDPTTNASVATITVGSGPDGVGFDGSYVWVSNATDDTVSKVDIVTNTVVATVTVGDGPRDISYDGRFVWVVNTNSSNVSIIDPLTNAVIATKSVGTNPYGIAFDGSHMWIENYGSGDVTKLPIGVGNGADGKYHVNLIPDTNDAFAVGRSGAAWRGYFSSATGTEFTVTSTATGYGTRFNSVGLTSNYSIGLAAPIGIAVLSPFVSPALDDTYSLGYSVGPLRWKAFLSSATATHLDVVDNSLTPANGAGQFIKLGDGTATTRGVVGVVTSTSASLADIPTSNIVIGTGTVKSAGGMFVNGVSSGINAAVLAIDQTSSSFGGAILGFRKCGTQPDVDIMLLATESNARAMSVRCDGRIFADNGSVGTLADYAEYFPTNDPTISVGEVVAMTGTTATSVKRAMEGDREFTLGIISAKPFMLGNAGPDGIHEGDPNYKIVGLLGQLPVKTSNANGEINAGDRLMAGDDGYAVKASGVGKIIGQAMESLASSTGMVLTYVDPQWSADGIFESGDHVTNIQSIGIATAATSTFDSNGITFQGSIWDAASSTAITSNFTLINDVISASSSVFTVRGNSNQGLLTISDLGNVDVSGDLTVGKRLFLGSKMSGSGSSSTYIYVDDTLAPTSTYIATNADGWSTSSTYDYAERFRSDDVLMPGDLVVADAAGVDKVKRATTMNDVILGIVSTRPGFVTGAHATGTYPIALAGRVPTRVSTKNGSIAAGDQLAPSDEAGVAVKAIGSGPVVGIALEAYDAPMEGKISVFVQPGWKGGEIVPSGDSPSTVTYQEASAIGVSPRTGLAKIAAGAKQVNVSFASLNAYPLVTVAPYGQTTGGWWLTNVNDHGFTIVLGDAPTFDLVLAWKVEPSQSGNVEWFSDGTSAPYDVTSGEPSNVLAPIVDVSSSTGMTVPPIETTTTTTAVIATAPEATTTTTLTDTGTTTTTTTAP